MSKIDKNKREFMKKFGLGFGAGLLSLPFVNALQNINFNDSSKSMKVIEGSSDPVTSLNPSEVGIYYLNTSSGELFVCIDNTSNDNVWKSTGIGTTSVIELWKFGGTVLGYTAGGKSVNSSSILNTIDKFSFSSEGNATDVGDLTVSRDTPSGQQY